MNYTKAGIIIFSLAVILAPWYTTADYDPVSNVISLLGAQNTSFNFVMISAFICLGSGIILDGIFNISKQVIPFICFGLFIALAGMFPHKPLSPDVNYSLIIHQTHGILATLSGISISLGLIYRAILGKSIVFKIITFTISALCLILPISMLLFVDFQGLIQRFMYLIIFIWLWQCFPFTSNDSQVSAP